MGGKRGLGAKRGSCGVFWERGLWDLSWKAYRAANAQKIRWQIIYVMFKPRPG